MKRAWEMIYKKDSLLIILLVFVVLCGIITLNNNNSKSVFSMPLSKIVILIDAGHGGWDPGKIGNGETNESEINLDIALKLQQILEQSGAYVLLTRAEDNALDDTKRKDLKNRVELANGMKVDLMISIHQNSYPDASVKGAQVFYYADSEMSKALATAMQARLIEVVNNNNKRQAKANEDYYILKQTKIPACIVECGFLSSEDERNNLLDDTYQERIAWAMYLGIYDYLTGQK